jgi:hypothetical protein
MKIIMLIPRVVQGYLAQFPDKRNDAYPYFNYDRRVVEERVPRGDCQAQYKGPENFTDTDYDSLVTHARTLVNPILAKYSDKVANEDALHLAIRSFNNGMFDGKVNASRYGVLLNALDKPVMNQPLSPIMAAKKKEKKTEDTVLRPSQVKQLGLENVPTRSRSNKDMAVVKQKGKIVIKKPSK